MNNMNITSILHQKKTSSILVIGEAMLDEYLSGNAKRICPEAPVPIVDVQEIKKYPGAAANTAINLSHLNADVYFLSVIGNDVEGKIVKKLLKKEGVNVNSIITEKKRKTITKKRISAHDHLLVRFDEGTTDVISETIEEKVITQLLTLYPKIEAIVISDYGYGLITPRIIDVLSRLQKHFPKILAVDSKYPERFIELHPTLVKPNYYNAISLLGIRDVPQGQKRLSYMASYGEMLFEKTGAEIVALTADVEGSLIFENGRRIYQTFTQPDANSKAAGAGDTYISAFTYALTLGAPIKVAAEIASAAALVVVKKNGTATCTKDELLLAFAKKTKYLSYEKISPLFSRLKKESKRVVFTNGCFDILHSGHVDYLNHAKQLGDVLVVGLNSDSSVSRLKGKDRPVNTLTDRMHVLSGLSSIDYIIPFETDTPIPLIEKLQPDIYVKGGDYRKDMLPEAAVVERYGGTVEILPFIKDKSTTSIIKRILANPM